jgi:hypothetical protein
MCQKSKKSCLEPETVEMPEFEEALPHRTQVSRSQNAYQYRR